MCSQINMHSAINYFIYIYILSRNNKGNTNLSIQTCRLTDWSFYRALALWYNHTHRSLSFNFTFSLFLTLEFSREFCCLLSNLIYNLLLLFIGNLKITSTWIYRLAINGYNNYLPTNLASEINLTSLDCRIVDSSLLSDWSTRSELIRICE